MLLFQKARTEVPLNIQINNNNTNNKYIVYYMDNTYNMIQDNKKHKTRYKNNVKRNNKSGHKTNNN